MILYKYLKLNNFNPHIYFKKSERMVRLKQKLFQLWAQKKWWVMPNSNKILESLTTQFYTRRDGYLFSKSMFECDENNISLD